MGIFFLLLSVSWAGSSFAAQDLSQTHDTSALVSWVLRWQASGITPTSQCFWCTYSHSFYNSKKFKCLKSVGIHDHIMEDVLPWQLQHYESCCMRSLLVSCSHSPPRLRLLVLWKEVAMSVTSWVCWVGSTIVCS